MQFKNGDPNKRLRVPLDGLDFQSVAYKFLTYDSRVGLNDPAVVPYKYCPKRQFIPIPKEVHEGSERLIEQIRERFGSLPPIKEVPSFGREGLLGATLIFRNSKTNTSMVHSVNILSRHRYKFTDGYYHTLFHELVHASDPFTLDPQRKEDTPHTSEGECIALLGGHFLSLLAGLDPTHIMNIRSEYDAHRRLSGKGNEELVEGTRKALEMLLGI